VDVAFTSPPYFNLELYSDEPTQSHLKFPTWRWWTDAFLGQMCCNAHHALRPGGYLLLNVAGNALLREAGLMLEDETIRCAVRAGFVQEQTVLMLKPTATGGPAADLSASEPILVFRKPMHRVAGAGAAAMTSSLGRGLGVAAHGPVQPSAAVGPSWEPGCAGQQHVPGPADQTGLDGLLDGW
jgi:hypothetical protein